MNLEEVTPKLPRWRHQHSAASRAAGRNVDADPDRCVIFSSAAIERRSYVQLVVADSKPENCGGEFDVDAHSSSRNGTQPLQFGFT
jgi:hypothetical protein